MRLAYLRWLDGLGRLSPESDAEFAKRVGVGYEWLKKWMRRDDAPSDRHKAAALAGAFDQEAGRWLLDEQGEPPLADLWAIWKGQNAGGHYLDMAGRHGLTVVERDAEEELRRAEGKPKRRAGGRGRA